MKKGRHPGQVMTLLCASRRGRQRLKTEVLFQRLDQLPVFRWCPVQAEAGVVMLRGRVFVAPQTARRQVDDLLTALAQGDFQTQLEFGTDHHRQLADKHQTVFGDVAQKPDGFIGDAVEHSQKIRQLVSFDSTVGKHERIAMHGPMTGPHCASERTCPAGPLSPLPVWSSPRTSHAGRRCCAALESRL